MRELPEPDPFFDAVGRVAFAWAQLESELSQLLVALLHTPMAGLLAVGQSFTVVCSHIQAVADLPVPLEQHDVPRQRLTDDFRGRIRDVLSRSRTLSHSRQALVHGLWLHDPSTGTWASIRPRQHELLMKIRPFTVEEMHRVAGEIQALTADVERLGSNVDPRLYGLREAPGFGDKSGHAATPPA
jgi:hypothetical protein